MSNSRKLMVKLDNHPRRSPKHSCAARKATSTEVEQDDPEPKQTKLSTTTGTQFVCFCHWLWGKNYLQDSFTCKFQSPLYTLFFVPQGAAPREGSAKLPPSLAVSCGPLWTSSSTLDTSSSEGKDEKDLILPKYPSDELRASDSRDSDPEDASS